MDPQEPRSKAPSLLTGDTHPALAAKSSERILSGLQGSPTSPPRATRSRRWVWPLALLGVAAAAVLLLNLGGVFDPAKSVATPTQNAESSEEVEATTEQPTQIAGTPVASSPSTAAPLAVANKTATSDQNAAVILADQIAASSPAANNTVATATPAANANAKDTAALSAMFAPHAGKKAPVLAARTAQRSKAPPDDADVDLLTMLIAHLQVNDAAKKTRARHPKRTAAGEVLPADCPAANTEAGVACRQRFCAAHSGQGDASCPAASPGGS